MLAYVMNVMYLWAERGLIIGGGAFWFPETARNPKKITVPKGLRINETKNQASSEATL